MSIMRLTAPETSKNKVLVSWLASQLPHLSRSYAQRLLNQGAIRVNGVVSHQWYKLAGGEEIEIQWPKGPDERLKPEPMTFDVLYEDQEVVVINKSAGIVVHPSPGHRRRTVINGLVARYPESKPYLSGWPRLVHRLDRDTSGVLIAARTLSARRLLQKQFSQRTTKKEYLALVLGQPESTHGTINGPIGRDNHHWGQYGIVPNGRPATTHYEVLECFTNSSLLLVRPITGRTHQIRVHLKAIGLPVAGDQLYGPYWQEIRQLSRQFLHAARLSITTPDGQRRTFEAPLPAELEAVLQNLREQSALPSFPAQVKQTHHIYSFFSQVERTPPIPLSIELRSFLEEIERTEGLDRLGEIELIEGVEGLEDFEDFEGGEVEEMEEIEDFEDLEYFKDFQTKADLWLSEVLWGTQEG